MKVGLNHAYLYPFRRSSFLKCALQLKIAKVNKNLLFWKFRVFQIHRCWYDWKARHYNACCDRQYVHAYLQPFSRKTSIQRGGPLFDALVRTAQVSLNLENRNLDRRNLRPVLKISYAACPCLSQLISAQLALEMCLAVRKKSIKTLILAFKVIQGHW